MSASAGTELARQLLAGVGLAPESLTPVGGGDINQSFALTCGGDRLFLKVHASPPTDMFAAEADALQAIARTGTVRVPAVVTAGDRFLLLEYVPMRGRDAAADAQLGRALARLHQTTTRQYGWHRDNYIGTTPQPNQPSADWVAFYRESRLRPQVELLAGRTDGETLRALSAQLSAGLPRLFEDYQPPAALLHGDLWSGNAAATTEGQPVVYDPASYYGDPETDLAMAELFGGFSPDFLAGYQEIAPVHPGYGRRRRLYQLYHMLNHANLFGGGYISRAEQMMRELVAAIEQG